MPILQKTRQLQCFLMSAARRGLTHVSNLAIEGPAGFRSPLPSTSGSSYIANTLLNQQFV
ncbi:uncharacterized protein METZ01_LOCUS380239, partial [marine metagenome]